MLEHGNKSRKFAPGEIINERPGRKSHRLQVKESTIKLANEMRALVELFGLSEKDINNLIRNEFGVGVGYHTTRMFLDPVYGPGFNIRNATREKYEYLVTTLKRHKKQFAKSGK